VTLVGLVVLSACTIDDPISNSISRSAAKQAVTPIVEERFPGLPASQVSDCIIDNSNTSELIEFTKAATFGPDDQTYATVIEVASRRETVDCISQVALAEFVRV
jgi:hypothetical protein